MIDFIKVKHAYDLKYNVILTGSSFFDRSVMRFFGDTMKNYTCSSKTVHVVDSQGNYVDCYELKRKKAVKIGRFSEQTITYFDASTFMRVHVWIKE